jgi:hypothetical protein
MSDTLEQTLGWFKEAVREPTEKNNSSYQPQRLTQ